MNTGVTRFFVNTGAARLTLLLYPSMIRATAGFKRPLVDERLVASVSNPTPPWKPRRGGAQTHWCLHGSKLTPAGTATLRSNRPLAGREGHHPASQRQARGEEGGGGGVIPGMAARSRWLWGPFFFVCSNKGCFLPPGGCRDTASPRCVSDDGLKAMYGA